MEQGAAGRIDPQFTAYPLGALAGTALQRASELGAQHADFRAELIRGQQIGLSDGSLETLFDSDDLGLAVRAIVDGSWGFAAAVDLTTDAAARAAGEAVDVARVAAAISNERIELADEPGHGEVSWVSAYATDPFEISVADKIALLARWSSALLADGRIDHVDASLLQVRECKFYADGGTTALQQRVRLHPEITAVAVDPSGRFETMRTLAPPAGRGYEYLTGTGWDFEAELAELSGLLAAKAGRAVCPARPVRPGHRPVESVAHDPRVGRACHRAGPGARLRGRLRRHLLRHHRQAGQPAVRIAGHARNRGPDDGARAGDGGLRRRGRSADLARSAWAGAGTRDFTDVDVAASLATRLGWAARRVELPAGRYETLLPPTAVADLMIYLYWSAGAKGALDGRSVFSRPGGTRVGEQLADAPLTLRSNPAEPGLECAPFLLAPASSRTRSVFDNRLPLEPTEWISGGQLAALVQTRRSAQLTGLPVTPAEDNLILESGTGMRSLPEMVAGTGRDCC